MPVELAVRSLWEAGGVIKLLALPLVCAALGVAACGGGEEDRDAAAAPDPQPTANPAAEGSGCDGAPSSS